MFITERRFLAPKSLFPISKVLLPQTKWLTERNGALFYSFVALYVMILVYLLVDCAYIFIVRLASLMFLLDRKVLEAERVVCIQWKTCRCIQFC